MLNRERRDRKNEKRWMSKWERSKVYISIKSNTEILIFKRLKRDLGSRTEQQIEKVVTFIELENIWLGCNPSNLKIFIFKPKLSFSRKNHKNDDWDGFPDFYVCALYMIYAIFLKIAIPQKRQLRPKTRVLKLHEI